LVIAVDGWIKSACWVLLGTAARPEAVFLTGLQEIKNITCKKKKPYRDFIIEITEFKINALGSPGGPLFEDV
jgi:hypothetical protein